MKTCKINPIPLCIDGKTIATLNSYTYYVKNIDIVCNLGYFYRNMGGGAT